MTPEDPVSEPTTPGSPNQHAANEAVDSFKGWRLVWRDMLALLAVLFGGLGLRLLFFNGLRGHDDWIYLFYVRSILNGNATEAFSSLWGLRFGVVFPLVGLFKLFGPSLAAAFTLPLFLSIGSIGLVFLLAWRLFDDKAVAFAAAGLLAVSPLDTFVASTVRGDVEVGFFALLSLVLLVHARQSTGVREVALLAGAGAAIGIAYEVKEAGLLALVAAGAFLALDGVRERRVLRRSVFVGIGFLLVLVFEGAILFRLTGNPLQRLERGAGYYDRIAKQGELEEDSTLRQAYLPCLVLSLPGRECEELLTWGDWNNTYTTFGWFGPLAFAAGIALALRRDRRVLLLVAWCGAILLYLQFGTMNLHRYVPFHKEPRYLTLVSGPALVLLAAGLVRVTGRIEGPRRQNAILATTIACLALDSTRTLKAFHRIYVRPTQFNARIAEFLRDKTGSPVFAESYIVQYLELVSGYRYPSRVHGFHGSPGFGPLEDTAFFECRRAVEGSYYVATTGHPPACEVRPGASWRNVLFVPGDGANLEIYRLEARGSRALLDESKASEDGGGSLGRRYLIRASQTHGELRFDRNFNDEPIVLGGVTYLRGLGTHALSEIEYRIPEGVATFSASVGLDDSEDHSPGSVVFKVFVDDDLRFESSLLRWDSPTAKVRVPVRGGSRLRLVVENGGDGDTCDHASWADAQFEVDDRRGAEAVTVPPVSPQKTR